MSFFVDNKEVGRRFLLVMDFHKFFTCLKAGGGATYFCKLMPIAELAIFKICGWE